MRSGWLGSSRSNRNTGCAAHVTRQADALSVTMELRLEAKRQMVMNRKC